MLHCAFACSLSVAATGPQSTCQIDRQPTFGGEPGLNGWVRALAEHDGGGGSGPALFAGGTFTQAGGAPASFVAKWDGSLTQDLNARWSAKPNQNPGAGAVVQAPLWYRDPFSTSNQSTSFSNALEFLVVS